MTLEKFYIVPYLGTLILGITMMVVIFCEILNFNKLGKILEEFCFYFAFIFLFIIWAFVIQIVFFN